MIIIYRLDHPRSLASHRRTGSSLCCGNISKAKMSIHWFFGLWRAVYIQLLLLLKKYEILKNNFFFLLESFTVVVFGIETVQHILYCNDEVITNVHPFPIHLSISTNILQNFPQLALQFLFSWLYVPLKWAQLSSIFDDVDLFFYKFGKLL